MAWLSVIVQGTLLGGLYALFAIGLSLTFGIMRLVNIGHGDLIVLAAFIALIIVQGLGLHPLVSLVLVVPAMFVLGYLLQRGVLNRTLGECILPPLLVTFGMSVIIENVLLQLFGADTRRLHVGALETDSLVLPGGIAIGVFPLLIFTVAVAVIAALQLLFYRTSLGRAFRATSDDAATAELMGADNRHLYALAMAIALAVTGLAGVFLAIRSNFDPSIGPGRLIFAFEAVIIGGLGSLWGTLAGAVILGIAQSVGSALKPEWQILAGDITFLVILVLRPNGLFQRTRD
ncbi:MAG: branched-chain amino acid ABC transporter permease [Stellaceae bacterium]